MTRDWTLRKRTWWRAAMLRGAFGLLWLGYVLGRMATGKDIEL